MFASIITVLIKYKIIIGALVVKGAVMGTVACYMTACVMDGVFLEKYIKQRDHEWTH